MLISQKEDRAPKNWCFCIVVLEKILESALDFKELKPVNPKGYWSRIVIGRTEALILCPPDAPNQLIGKDPDAGKDWRQEKGSTEDKMVGWHHQLNGHEFKQAPRFGDGQGGLVCYRHGVPKSQTWLSDWPELDLKQLQSRNPNYLLLLKPVLCRLY